MAMKTIRMSKLSLDLFELTNMASIGSINTCIDNMKYPKEGNGT